MTRADRPRATGPLTHYKTGLVNGIGKSLAAGTQKHQTGTPVPESMNARSRTNPPNIGPFLVASIARLFRGRGTGERRGGRGPEKKLTTCTLLGEKVRSVLRTGEGRAKSRECRGGPSCARRSSPSGSRHSRDPFTSGRAVHERMRRPAAHIAFHAGRRSPGIPIGNVALRRSPTAL